MRTVAAWPSRRLPTPTAHRRTGSILLFGVVAKERHAASTKQAERDEHHHCPCYTAEKHYWRPVAQRSLQLGVKLHAATHDGYTPMFIYVRNPSPKKPTTELDLNLWYSEDHPKGETLRKLLEAGVQATHWLQKRGGSRSSSDGVASRLRPADLFTLAPEHGIRSVQQLRQKAHADAALGDRRLAEFCTVHDEAQLDMYLKNVWEVQEAPQRALASTSNRITKLQHAAANHPCKCSGRLPALVGFILHHQGENIQAFCTDVMKALRFGACRGLNMAIIGPPGCGKSSVFEALEEIYVVCGKPQRESSFPFADIIDADVLLWQEFNWEPKMCAFEDLTLAATRWANKVRIPSQKPLQHRNKAPMFYTAWAPLSHRSNDCRKSMTYTAAMGERFNTRTWTRPLPAQGRLHKLPQCGRCYAQFLLNNAA